MDIIVTVPKGELGNIEKEDAWIAEMHKQGKTTFSFWSMPRKPVDIKEGDRVYFVVDGFVTCYHEFIGFVYDFTCEVTGRFWSGLNLKMRNPPIWLKKPFPMKGFRGFHYVREPIPS